MSIILETTETRSFLYGVNRVLRQNSIITGDDDDISSFTDLQHKASTQLAMIAIQSTITELSSDKCLPIEEVDATITMVQSQRTYDLASDFVRFIEEKPFLLELDGSGNSANRVMQMYPGGEAQLKREILDYREQEGTPSYFYNMKASTKSIGVFHIPDANYNGVDFQYTYEKSVYPVIEVDNLPFITRQEVDTFIDMASRRFQFIFTKQPMEGLEQDIIYKGARTSLLNILRQNYPTTEYGYSYS
jgi:hypothetical protein